MDYNQIDGDTLKQDRFKQTDWELLYKRLMYFTHNQLKKRFILRKSPWSLDTLADEIVRTAISKVIFGDRNWNPSKDPDLYYYLSGSVIRSLMSNFFKNHGYRYEECISEHAEGGADCATAQEEENILQGEGDATAEFLYPETPPDPFDEVVGKELYNKLKEAAHQEGDWKSEIVLDCFWENITKTSDISEATGIDTKEISNIKRRIQRKTTNLINIEQEEIRGQVSRKQKER